MSTQIFPLIGGRVLRATITDACGAIDYGDATQLVTSGFVQVGVTANYDDGTEIVVRNAAGRRCISRAAEPELINLALTVQLCQVDPALYTALTGYPALYNALGDLAGFRINRSVRPRDVGVALELWSNAYTDGCDVSGAIPYGYLLWPFLTGGKVSDYTIEDGAATFSVSDMLTRDGSGWDVGPYDVIDDALGAPGPLSQAVDSLDHQWLLRTLIAPPEETNGFVPLDDPDTAAATSATAGTPGTFNGVRPATLAALQASAITSPSGVTPWTTGQFVILGNGTFAHWAGSGATPKWAAGKAT
jgi:hypothetical protein